MRIYYEVAYVPFFDMTIIKKNTETESDFTEELVGFYHGEPNEEDTEYYKNKGVSASCELY